MKDMPVRSIAIGLALALSAGAALGADRDAGSQTPGPASVWIGAPGYDARMNGVVDSTGVVLTSEDYQQLLYVPARGPRAFVFFLRPRELGTIPRSALKLDNDGARLHPAPACDPLGSFQVDGARIDFESGSLTLDLDPKPDMVGEVALADLLARKPGYQKLAAEYHPDRGAIRALHGVDREVEILVFFGSWCGTCSARVPLFLKTMDEAANSRIHVRFIGVKEDHSAPPELTTYNVHTTPTFIVRTGGTELGRIDKRPRSTLEGDAGGYPGSGVEGLSSGPIRRPGARSGYDASRSD